MKGIILIGMVLLLAAFLMSGCSSGISQEDYDAVVAERDAAQAQVTSLQDDISAAEADLAALQAEVDALESDLATAEARIDELEEELGISGEGEIPEDWVTYTDEEYGFSISHPSEWESRTTTIGDRKYEAHAAGSSCAIVVYVAETELTHIQYATQVWETEAQATNWELIPLEVGTLADGTPTEAAYWIGTPLGTITSESYTMGVEHEGMLYVVFISSTEDFGGTYDQDLFEQVAHTLTFL